MEHIVGKYIFRKNEENDKGLICSHPLVNIIWQTGTLDIDSTKKKPLVELWTNILFKDGTRKEIREIKMTESDTACAEEYLQSLTHTKE